MLLSICFSSSRESAENCYVPNAGFYEDAVYEDPALFAAGQASDSCEDDSSLDQRTDLNNEQIVDGSAASGIDSAPTEDSAQSNEVNEQITTGMADLQITENASGPESIADDPQLLSVEDVDQLLDKCLLQALHTTLKDKDLPIPGSTLW